MENKRQKIRLRSDTKYRQSFSDRFCDDLCEHLFCPQMRENSISFDCVSKQWKKLIFNKQNTIEINSFSRDYNNTLNRLHVRIDLTN
jgi:hypothetical protein